MSLRVLFAASEAVPLSKTGGLADVADALPAALARLGLELRVLTPAYRGTVAKLSQPREVARVTLRGQDFRIVEGRARSGGAPQWLADCPALFDREGSPYADAAGRDFADNDRRYGLFSELAARLALGEAGAGWRADLLHLNDWHTGLAAAWLAGRRPRPAIVFTIHNLAYQGNYPPGLAGGLGLPEGLMHPGGLEYHGQVSCLKAGLVYADAITTVSPGYAREIQTPAYGEGMDGVLRDRASVLSGIVNGIDTEAWNPADDPLIAARYGQESLLAGKRANRAALQERLGLARDDQSLLVAFVGRLAHQKGADLLLTPAAAIDRAGLQFALLGSGDRALEQALLDFARARAGRVAVTVGYDEALAHQIEAGADAFLMPSRYEPCGLNQMYSQRYGTVPVVRRTGGLADTVTDATPATLADGSATGILFDHADGAAVGWALGRALELHRQPEAWRSLQQNGMRRDFGWARAAGRYAALYRSLVS